MFDWLSGAFLGIPLLLLLLFIGYTFPKWISWTLFLVLAIVWAGFLPALINGMNIIRGLLGV